MPRTATNLSLPVDLVREVDALAGSRNRSAFVEAAIRDRLRRERLRQAVRSVAGTWSVNDYPEFATPQLVAGWVQDRRTERTQLGTAVLDGGAPEAASEGDAGERPRASGR